jgi:hypothetical protein
VVLAGDCAKDPGVEPRDDCAEYICRDPAPDAPDTIAGLHKDPFGDERVCKAYLSHRPAGCVSGANTYEVDGKILPACLAEYAPGSDVCQFPAETWTAWSAAKAIWDDAKGPKGCREFTQLDGRCLCLSAQKPGQVDGEVGSADALPAEKRTRLVVCPGKDKGAPVVSWEKDAGEPKPGCVVAARPMVDVSLDADTDLVEQLRAACAPCPVSGRSWSHCPHCILTPGGCAEACRLEVVTP